MTYNTQEIIYIKNMIGSSCVKLVSLILNSATEYIKILNCELGKVKVTYNSNEVTSHFIESILRENGFEVLKNDADILVEKIKSAAIELIFLSSNNVPLIQNTEYISAKLQVPYYKLGKLFSKKTNITLEKYIILLKIEKVKELIHEQKLTFSEIALMLGYNSVQYLGNQFKKKTGFTMSEYKKKPNRRIPLDKLISKFSELKTHTS